MIAKANGLDLLKEFGLKRSFDFPIRPLDIPDVGIDAQKARDTPEFRRVLTHLTQGLEDTTTMQLASHLLPDIPPKDACEVILSRCLREMFLNGYMWGNRKDPSTPLLFAGYESPIARAASITDMGGGFNTKQTLAKKANAQIYWNNQGRGLNVLDNAPYLISYIPPGSTSLLIIPLTSKDITQY